MVRDRRPMRKPQVRVVREIRRRVPAAGQTAGSAVPPRRANGAQLLAPRAPPGRVTGDNASTANRPTFGNVLGRRWERDPTRRSTRLPSRRAANPPAALLDCGTAAD